MKKILAAALALWMTLGAAALAEGTFRVGVKQDVYGFGYYDEATGEFSGMEIELGEKLAEALGYDEVEYTAVTAATRGQMLDNDELVASLRRFTIKPERKESWDFSTAVLCGRGDRAGQGRIRHHGFDWAEGKDGRRILRLDLGEGAFQGDGGSRRH